MRPKRETGILYRNDMIKGPNSVSVQVPLRSNDLGERPPFIREDSEHGSWKRRACVERRGDEDCDLVQGRCVVALQG